MSDSEYTSSLARPEQSGDGAETVWHRVAHVFARRLEEVEGLVTVAMALADRTGTDLRDELESVAESLTEQLEAVAAVAEVAATAAARSREPGAPDRRSRRGASADRRRHPGASRWGGFASTSERHPARTLRRTGRAHVVGRRIEQVEGAMAVTSGLADRFGTELREGLDEVDATAADRSARLWID